MNHKIDLSLAKKLLAALENKISTIDEISDEHELITRMAECSGIASYLANEASALSVDCTKLVSLKMQEKYTTDKITEKLAGLFGDKGFRN